MNRLVSFACLALLLTIVSVFMERSSYAAYIQYTYTAEVFSANDIFSEVSGTFSGGALFEERTGGSNNPSLYTFSGTPFFFAAEIPGAAVNSDTGVVQVADDGGSFPTYGDYVRIAMNNSQYLYVSDFITYNNSVFAGTDIPTISVLNSLPNGIFSIFDRNTNEYVLQARLTSQSFDPVPIPGAVWLFASGLVGLAGIRSILKK
jgi:hypothetical protein